MAADLLACRGAELGRGCSGKPANKDAIDFGTELGGGRRRLCGLRGCSGCFRAAALQGRVWGPVLGTPEQTRR